jgi:hypothetical protein
MRHLRGLKQKLSRVSRLCKEKDYDTALAEVESLLKTWPGNAHLQILWASFVQLQENPQHDLDEVKRALQRAVELDNGSAAATLERGHFLDNVEDDPQAASKVYAEGVTAARHLLIDGLIGQAKVFRQLDKRAEFFRCPLEILHLARFETGPKRDQGRRVWSRDHLRVAHGSFPRPPTQGSLRRTDSRSPQRGGYGLFGLTSWCSGPGLPPRLLTRREVSLSGPGH